MINKSILKENLQKYFGYSSFRTGQEEIILDVMKGKDVLGILPTGSGKSICYQLPAKLLKGVTIVVSPLISLMVDQVRQLKASHFKEVAAINSFISRTERDEIYKNIHYYKLVYVSPEILQQDRLQKLLKELHVSLFVIDEAHCISQWGHEFRPDYLRLEATIRLLNNPPILALTATATMEVQSDIVETLGRKEIARHVHPMDKDNITFCVQQLVNENDKLQVITTLLNRYRIPTIIYFSSREATEKVSEQLKSNTEARIAFYHGGMDQYDRVTVQQQFMSDQLDVICCTSAFGMGINKSNIRLIIHFHMPPNLESFIQEVGRGGRDGDTCVSLLLSSPGDVFIPQYMIQGELPNNTQIEYTFHQLQKLVEANQSLPSSTMEIENYFQLSEIQWRFLLFQLEKRGIINNRAIYLDPEKWNTAQKEIIEQKNHRSGLKEKNLTEILRWIEEKDCLRKKLYSTFQNTVKPPLFKCCSNCDFQWSQWTPSQTNVTKNSFDDTWEVKLRKLLLFGTTDEAK
ncbi:ATP-dependent DNA helicase RecQ [Virgibacillus sp. SK37]|uniref:RecQ family ATP-dependent DNA helicase n=1 Tax=Virgibacillus sp. SK37 TaxID=403957 RepID=UPI0004D15B3B|nr:ATP-dependent DNA helicase RecQ [Virgibacillus sp. SK37]AIF43541.1 ATP-dependent DNA helicase RecQ [Virgibacillus sp. SK37]